MRLFHLLPAKWALDDFVRKRLKISFLEDLNDPFEFLSLDTTDPMLQETLIRTRKSLGQQNGVLCFSRSWANPVLWSHYADKHKGIALGFEVQEVAGEPQGIPVKYVSSRLVHSVSDVQGWKPQDMLTLLATKFEHWRYEDEVRIYASIVEKDQESGLAFVPFSEDLALTDVVLGVRCSVERTQIEEIVKDWVPTVRVISARLDSSSFSVVE
ncbi:MAG: DUF2971 domain-containing protein [Pseudomonadota bacterium]|nr:DUF2971 domain-containing protein [Pseudomonadota bacterium]